MFSEIYILEFLPLLILGLFCGIVRFARGENDLLNDETQNENKIKKTRIYRAVDVVLTSSFLAFISFACLSFFTELTYIFKVGISSAIALFGIDKVLDIVQRVISLKQGKKDDM